VFVYQSVPWNDSGHIRDFTVGTDRLDFSALFAASGYTGSNPIGDGYVRIESNGAGGTRISYDRDGFGTGNPWPAVVTTLDNVSPAGLTSAQLFGGAASPPPPPPPPLPPASGSTFTANGTRDQVLTGGSGNDIFNTGQNSVIITGGGGADRFVYNQVPWNNTGHIRDFTSGSDVLDFRGMFQGTGYSGSNPVADGYLRFVADGAGNTQVLFDRDGFGTANPWPAHVTTIDHVLPSGIHTGDWLFR
jgi:hypothetical protein